MVAVRTTKETNMTTIGTFTQTTAGYTGTLRTLTLDVKVRLDIPVHESPPFRTMGDQDSGACEASVPEHVSPRFRTM